VIRSPEVKERFEQLNIETRANTPEEFQAFVKDQMQRWGKVVKDAGIKLG
jgi:tripartite-type tricarboxylate transporter receptor subunit TctC